MVPVSLKTIFARLFDVMDRRDQANAWVVSGCAPTAFGVGSLRVDVAAGVFVPNAGAHTVFAGGNLTPVAPVLFSRIDLIYISAAGVLTLGGGVEAATSPVPIALPAGATGIALLSLAVGQTDYTGTNYIFDVRQFNAVSSPPDGTAAAPAIPYGNEKTSGPFRVAAGVIGWSILGVKRMQLAATSLSIFGAGVVVDSNNVTALGERDRYGTTQNLAQIDADDNANFGPASDMRITNFFANPVNLHAPHAQEHFYGSVFPHQWGIVPVQGGTPLSGYSITMPGSLATQFGEIDLATGAVTAGDGVEINVKGGNYYDSASGSALWITALVSSTLNQIVEFGWKDALGTSYIRYILTEVGAAANFFCQTAAGGAPTSVDTGVLNTGATRYTFALDNRTLDTAVFWLSDGAGGLFQQKASIGTTTPAAGTLLFPYIRIVSNGAAANKILRIDQVYPRKNQ